MLTPATPVTLVHAVRRPRDPPAGSLRHEPERVPGQTSAALKPEPSLLGINAASTVRLDLTASWREVDDNRETEVKDALVQSVAIERGDEALREPLRHEFADTRHRTIAYTATAVSRFRGFFEEQDNENAFHVSTPLPTVSTPSSARPAPPIVLSIVPAFRWEQEDLMPEIPGMQFVRRRMGGCLRVELQRPWRVTGEGEQLAVVTWPEPVPPSSAFASICEVGRDPIWDTGAVGRWRAVRVPRRAGRHTAALGSRRARDGDSSRSPVRARSLVRRHRAARCGGRVLLPAGGAIRGALPGRQPRRPRALGHRER